MRRLWLIIFGVVVLVVGVGTVAYASIPDASGVIHGCYKTSNPARGAVTVIDSDLGQTCPSGTTPLNWSQTGPQGPAGPPGLASVHVVTTEVPGALLVTALCPGSETALGVAFGIHGGGASPFSATPVLDGARPIGYQVQTSTVSSIHLTCAITTP